ncbi:putative diterpenoid dioxygenase [Mycobacterium ulcerans str. Harvey]|uniref:Diterpenoid dioxygenase n=1 Tax=Mycobacterium ulcerans str. Harvey TaxID=1299332 RepID=A0ABP3AD37_MYCUL|nr:putative diterpenoid dioxygenase [Mycobacterium ulcerans str. Harvey]
MEAVRAAVADAGLTPLMSTASRRWVTPRPPTSTPNCRSTPGLRNRLRYRRVVEPGDVGLPCRRRAARPSCDRLPDHSDAGRHRCAPTGAGRSRSAAGPHVRCCRGCPRPAVGPMDDITDLIAAHAYSAANWLALNCRRHMELYGTTREQLGWVALNGRRNAALNPLAVYREPMTMADYLGRARCPHHWACWIAMCPSTAASRCWSRPPNTRVIVRPALSGSRRLGDPMGPAAGFTAPTIPRWRCRTPRRRCGRAPR